MTLNRQTTTKTTRISKKKTIIKQDFKGCFTVLNVDGNVIFVKFYIVPLINELFYDLLKVFIVFFFSYFNSY